MFRSSRSKSIRLWGVAGAVTLALSSASGPSGRGRRARSIKVAFQLPPPVCCPYRSKALCKKSSYKIGYDAPPGRSLS